MLFELLGNALHFHPISYECRVTRTFFELLVVFGQFEAWFFVEIYKKRLESDYDDIILRSIIHPKKHF